MRKVFKSHLSSALRCRPGTNSFKVMRKADEYVDKTKVIVDFDACGQVPQLITLPRRFFKSMNLKSIREFYGIEVDEHGEKKDIKDRENRKIFKDLFVSQHETIWRKQGEVSCYFC